MYTYATCAESTLDKGAAYSQDINLSTRQRGNHINTMTARVHLQKKKISGREPQGAWHQDELISCTPPVVK
jgi:hypothetical protein